MTPPGAELEVVVVDDRSRRPGSLPPPRRGRRVPHRVHPRLRIAGGARQRGPSDPRRRPRPSGRARRPNLVRRARRRRDRPVPGSERARDRGGPRPGGRPASRQRLPHTGRPPPGPGPRRGRGQHRLPDPPTRLPAPTRSTCRSVRDRCRCPSGSLGATCSGSWRPSAVTRALTGARGPIGALVGQGASHWLHHVGTRTATCAPPAGLSDEIRARWLAAQAAYRAGSTLRSVRTVSTSKRSAKPACLGDSSAVTCAATATLPSGATRP